MQFLLGNMKLQLMEGIYYFTPAGYIWMLIFIVPMELGRMRDNGALDIVLGNPMAFLLAATLWFFVNLLSFGVIQTTSSLTFKARSRASLVRRPAATHASSASRAGAGAAEERGGRVEQRVFVCECCFWHAGDRVLHLHRRLFPVQQGQVWSARGCARGGQGLGGAA